MPADFEWVKEEGDLPDEDAKSESGTQGAIRWTRIKRVILIAIIAVAGMGVFWLLRQRIVSTEEANESDIRSIHRLLEQSVTRTDEDLFRTFLSGRDRGWSETYQELVRSGLLFNLQSFGLNQTAESPIIESVSLSPDLASADVYANRAYSTDVGSGITETVILQNILIYRRGNDRWLFSPPDNEFWGELQSVEGQFLHMSFPERDNTFAMELFRFVEGKLSEMCNQEIGIPCPDDFRVFVHLDSNPDNLLVLADSEELLNGKLELELPAPTLLGMPTNELSSRALQRGYASLILGPVIAQLVQWECCQHGLLFQALFARQLAELGLRPWPLRPANYGSLLNRLNNIYELQGIWLEQGLEIPQTEDWQEAYALVDFILSLRGEATISGMQKQLNLSSSYTDWLNHFVPGNISEFEFQRQWIRFVYSQAELADRGDDALDVEQDIQALCRTSEQEGASIYRYSPKSDAWIQESSSESLDFLTSLPNWQGVLTRKLELAQPRVVLWQSGQGRTIYDVNSSENQQLQFIGRIDPQGKRIHLLNLANRGDSRPANSETLHYSLRIDDCVWPDCEQTALPGLPFWSPDGDKAIYIMGNALSGSESGRLLLDEGSGSDFSPIGTGSWPIWLNDGTYGFLRPSNEIMIGSNPSNVTPAVTMNDLQSVISIEERPELLTIEGIVADPTGTGKLAIMASVRSLNIVSYFYFLYDHRTTELDLLVRLDDVQALLPEYSPNGQWLIIRTAEPLSSDSSEPWTMTVYDIEGKEKVIDVANSERRPIQNLWSADSSWILRAYDGIFDLIFLSSKAQRPIAQRRMLFHEIPGCGQAAWINRQ
jgi:hypothetical protein